MTDLEKAIELLILRVADAEQELDALRRSVRGDFPDLKDGVSVNDRLEALEAAPATTPQDVSLTPYVVQSAAGEGQAPEIELLAMEIEWGIPTADPTDTPTATITLQPCDQDGVPYANADTATVFICDDRSEVDLSGRGWLAADPEAEPAVVGTILSFLRFPWDVGSGPAVVGVLIGEGQGGPVFPVALTVTSTTSVDTGNATTQCGYEYDVADAITGRKLAGTDTDPAVAAADPIAAPHKWARPTVGYMIAATYGYACYDANDALSIGWINEVADQEACGDDDGSTYDQGTWS
jgi:hypothetical protein